MTTLTRKQREIRQREERILSLARDMLLADGYHGLSMDRIAEALEYSKGTIYQHFRNKEEILLALANEAMENRLRMFRRGAAFRGRARERLSAVGMAAELFFQLFPHHFHVEQVLRLSSVQEKTSPERRKILESCEAQCMAVISGVVRDGEASGDLSLPASMTAEDVCFGLWSLTFGGYSLVASSPSLAAIGIREPLLAIRDNANRLLDGLGWQPLSGAIEFPALAARIAAEVFPAETQQLAAR